MGGPDLAIEEELREDLKQLQARGVQNWVAEEVSEYLEGIGKLHGKLSHVLDVLEECFQGSNDQTSRLEYGVRALPCAFVSTDLAQRRLKSGNKGWKFSSFGRSAAFFVTFDFP